MSNLLYAIFRGPLPPGLKLPAGVAGLMKLANLSIPFSIFTFGSFHFIF